jgi:CRISPR/Cas system-associated exonuclease Cas4 (RecB family)
MQVSASKLKLFEACPKSYDYKYIQKLPELERDYFETGKRVEEKLYEFLMWEDKPGYIPWQEEPFESERLMAEALFYFSPFRRLIDDKELVFQKEYDTPLYKAFTDIETEDCVIDIKTSSMNWNEDTVFEHRWQAKIYTELTGKPFYFVIVNKKTFKCQIIKVPVKDLKDVRLKVEELKLAIELGVFQPRPSFRCRFCSFEAICKKDRWFTR